jgi:hypothetical protein
MDLDGYVLRRHNAQLVQRIELIEAILERAGIIDAVIGGIGPHVDPAPEDIGRISTYSNAGIAGRLGGWATDPSPDDYGRVGISERLIAALRSGFRPPRYDVDPSPRDLSRLSKAQLEVAIHGIAAERVRLDSMESLLKQQLDAENMQGADRTKVS